MKCRKKLAPIGIAIKKRLVEMNISKREFASMIGAHEDYLTLIYYGERSGTKYADKIYEVTGIRLENFKICA